MYTDLATLAIFASLFSIIAGRVERSAVTGPVIYVIFGLAGGPLVLGFLAMLAWVIFGAVAVGQAWSVITLDVLLYSLLSLTVIRMLPVILASPLGSAAGKALQVSRLSGGPYKSAVLPR